MGFGAAWDGDKIHGMWEVGQFQLGISQLRFFQPGISLDFDFSRISAFSKSWERPHLFPNPGKKLQARLDGAELFPGILILPDRAAASQVPADLIEFS